MTAVKNNAMELLAGSPGAVVRGLTVLKTNLYSGSISSSIASTLNTASSQISGLVSSNLDAIIAIGLDNPTLFDITLDVFDSVLKDVDLVSKSGSGAVSSTDAISALKNGSIDYVLSPSSPEQMIFGPQCPLPYRNQLPARTLYELGENFTNDTRINDGTEELDSCYLSTDNKDDRNGQYLTPEPLNYTWKSPEGSCIEIDDTGYRNEDVSTPKGIDNRGIRLTTSKGALLHLVDEKNYEGILLRDKNNNYIWIDSQTSTVHLYAKDFIENLTADRNLNCVNRREILTGNDISYVDKDKQTTIAGNAITNCGLNLIEDVGGTWSITVHGSVNIMAMQDANIVAQNKVVIGGTAETIINAAHITAQGGRIDWNSA
jgi:hypothetical protein